MKKTFWAVFAALSLLLGAGRTVVAQAVAPYGAAVPGRLIQAGQPGVAYMMVPASQPAADPNAALGGAPQISPFNISAGGACDAAPGCSCAACTARGCDSGMSCPSGGCSNSSCDDCCAEGWCDNFFAYGGFLYLRARNSEVAYALPVANPNVLNFNAPQGTTSVLDPDYQPGFFVGFGRYLDDCSSIGVQYTQFDSSTNNSISALGAGTPVIRSLISLPATASGNVDFTNAVGSATVRYKMLDLDYRYLFAYDCDYKLNFLAGARAAQLNQNLDARFTGLGNVRNTTDIDFYGAGMRLGLEGERYAKRGFLVYGKTFASFLAGEFQANYTQTSPTAPVTNLFTDWKGGRIVTILDLEAGFGWVNKSGNLRFTAGYLFSGWLNTVKTNDWIQAVQTSTFVSSYNNLGNTMTFDGLIARLEGRF